MFLLCRIPEKHAFGYLVIRLYGKWYTHPYTKWKSVQYLSHFVCLSLGYTKSHYTESRMLDLSGVGEAAARANDPNSPFHSSLELNPETLRAKFDHGMSVVYISCIPKSNHPRDERR